MGWKYGFESPFKAEVYFVNARVFTDNKWGTKNPVMLRDPEFGPIRIRAFGSFTFKVSDPQKLLAEIVGTDNHFTIDEIQEQLKSLAVSSFSDALAELKVSVLDMASNYDELSRLVCDRINPDFEKYGINVNRFLVENISLPENVEAALDKSSSMGILGNMNQYTQFQTANAIEIAAKNPSGETNAGMEMGMGFAMANQMAHALGGQMQIAGGAPPSASVPPPLPGASSYYVAINGQQAGPFPVAQLKPLVQSGQFQASSLVWKEGMAGWEMAQDVIELKPLFASVPPPLPRV
jgi:membrane protease subunit (stomatin/prohibitin family)